MKKLLTVLIFFTLFLFSVYANGKRDEVDYSNPVSIQDKILELTEKDFSANRDKISVLASHLTIEEREIVYSLMEIVPEGNASQNFFLGWGEGSFRLGDNTGGTFLWFLDTLSLAAILTPAIPLALDCYNAKQFTVTKEWETKWMYPLAISGLSAALLSRLISISFPSAYAKRRNFQYRDSLGLNEGISLFVIPQLDPINKNAGFTVCLSF